jgi:hypothetical protein
MIRVVLVPANSVTVVPDHHCVACVLVRMRQQFALLGRLITCSIVFCSNHLISLSLLSTLNWMTHGVLVAGRCLC